MSVLLYTKTIFYFYDNFLSYMQSVTLYIFYVCLQNYIVFILKDLY